MFMEVLRSTEAPRVAGQKKWLLLKKENEELPNFPHLSHPVTAVGPELMREGDAIICEDQRIKTQQMALKSFNLQAKC
jgi:hypothetical protein